MTTNKRKRGVAHVLSGEWVVAVWLREHQTTLLSLGGLQALARAIDAQVAQERERCAKIADEMWGGGAYIRARATP